MREVFSRKILLYNETTGQHENADIFRGESAYEAAVRLGYTTLTEEQWVKEYDTKRDQAIAEIESKRKTAVDEANAAIADIEQKGMDTLASIPEDYTALSNDVSQFGEELSQIAETHVSKNLFDPEVMQTVGFLNSGTQVLNTQTFHANYKTSDYIKIDPQTDYVFSLYSTPAALGSSRIAYALYDSNKVYIANTYKNASPVSNAVISTGEAAYLRVCADRKYYLQMEKGVESTAYEPYFEPYVTNKMQIIAGYGAVTPDELEEGLDDVRQAVTDQFGEEVRSSNNVLGMEHRDKDTFDIDFCANHWLMANSGTTNIAGGLPVFRERTDTTPFSFVGNYCIKGMGLSGATVVSNRAVRFLTFTKEPVSIASETQVGYESIVVIGTGDSSVAAGYEIQLPEFDDSEYQYMQMSIYYSDTLDIYGGTVPFYFSTKVPFAAADVDVYQQSFILSESVRLPSVAKNIPDNSIEPAKTTFFDTIASTNLYKGEHDIVQGGYPTGSWNATTAYMTSDFIQLPEDKKIVCNHRIRGLTLYSDIGYTDYTYQLVAGERDVSAGIAIGQMNAAPIPAGELIDTTIITNSTWKYCRLWLYTADTELIAANPLYVATEEDYAKGKPEPYYEPLQRMGAGYLKGLPVSLFENDAGYGEAAATPVRINAENSDRIVILGDSYTESSYTVKGKAYINKLSLFSDYAFENIAQSGDIYYGNINRIRNNTPRYGTTFIGSRPKYAMMCSFTNDIKTLTANEYADALRMACTEVIGRGVQPIICTEYHSSSANPMIMSVNAQVAREFGCPCWDISQIVQMIRGKDYAEFWGGSHPGSRTNAIESDNYEKHLELLERPTQSMKLFRVRSGADTSDIANLMFWTNEDRAKLFKEIQVGHNALTDAARVDTITGASVGVVNSEYQQLISKQAVSFDGIALASFVIPGNYRTTDAMTFRLASTEVPKVYIKDIEAGEYTRPQRYMRFDYGSDVSVLPAVGDKYTCAEIEGITLTVAWMTTGAADGDGIGSIFFSGAFGSSNYPDTGGTLTRVSGSGDETINYLYKSVGYKKEDLTSQILGGWTELEANEAGEYPVANEMISRVIHRDRVDMLIVSENGGFDITDIELMWYGRESKPYIRRDLNFIPNQARSGEEWFASPTFGAAGSADTNWGLVPIETADGCYPAGTTSVVEVSAETALRATISVAEHQLNLRYCSGKAILEVWARYFPSLYTDGSGDQITEDSYDYADLKVDINRGDADWYNVTLHERVNTHWKVVQIPIDLGGGLSTGNFYIKLYSDKVLQIARVSLKNE